MLLSSFGDVWHLFEASSTPAAGHLWEHAYAGLSAALLSTDSLSAAVQYPHVPIVHMILASCRSTSLSWFHLVPPTGKLAPGPLLLQRSTNQCSKLQVWSHWPVCVPLPITWSILETRVANILLKPSLQRHDSQCELESLTSLTWNKVDAHRRACQPLGILYRTCWLSV